MNYSQMIQSCLANAIAALIIVVIAALVVSACAPGTIQLPPITNPNWP